jgi:electron transfer flavoprotein beta subunit
VGPQVAEKLGIPQVTYAEEILNIGDGKVRVKRRLENGVEIVESPLPAVVTVNGTARPCRPRNAKLLQKYKHAKTITERQNENIDYIDIYSSAPISILPNGVWLMSMPMCNSAVCRVRLPK